MNLSRDKSFCFRLILFAGVTISSWFIVERSSAQIVPDDTLPNNSRVSPDCFNCVIEGGTERGNNLFHSFEQFSIPGNGVAEFLHRSTIQNIFTRVTGDAQSLINGTLQTTIGDGIRGNANLFLINPNGIIFGSGAQLNIGGSFLATTAESIVFSDDLQFSSDDSESSLLSINVPVGLQFGQHSGSIRNRSQGGIESRLNTFGEPVGLEVPSRQNLALIGNGVFFEQGNVTARSGRIEIGSVDASSLVSLIPEGQRFRLRYSTNQVSFNDVSLTDRSFIDTSGDKMSNPQGGAIQLRGQNIQIDSGSTISSTTVGGVGDNLEIRAESIFRMNNGNLGTFSRNAGRRAGSIFVSANERIRLSGNENKPIVIPFEGIRVTPSQLVSQAENGEGSSGNLFFETNRLILEQGSRIEASTFGRGRGGRISVNAEDIQIDGFNIRNFEPGEELSSFEPGEFTSGIVSQVGLLSSREDRTIASNTLDTRSSHTTGNAGRVLINTGRVTLTRGGIISTATFDSGNGGDLRIEASESIQLRGASPAITRNQFRSGIFVSAEPDATGNVGSLIIDSEELVVGDRAEISANNRGSGKPGVARITVQSLRVQNGGEIRASSLGSGDGGTLIVNADVILLSGQERILSEVVPSAIAALSQGPGNAGNLNISTEQLQIRNGATLSVSGEAEGAAGNLGIQSRSIFLNQGRIEAETQVTSSGESGANVELSGLQLLLMSDRSLISARAFDEADGGNVIINARDGFVTALDDQDSDIIANAFRGRGGLIEITTQGIFGLEERRAVPGNGTNDIDASSEFGLFDGEVIIDSPDIDPNRGLTELPSTLVDASRLIAQGCNNTAIAQTPSEFIVTGRGGLPLTPDGQLEREWLLPAWSIPRQDPSISTRQPMAPLRPSSQEEISQDTDIMEPGHQTYRIIEAQGWTKQSDGTISLITRENNAQLNVGANQICE